MSYGKVLDNKLLFGLDIPGGHGSFDMQNIGLSQKVFQEYKSARGKNFSSLAARHEAVNGAQKHLEQSRGVSIDQYLTLSKTNHEHVQKFLADPSPDDNRQLNTMSAEWDTNMSPVKRVELEGKVIASARSNTEYSTPFNPQWTRTELIVRVSAHQSVAKKINKTLTFRLDIPNNLIMIRAS